MFCFIQILNAALSENPAGVGFLPPVYSGTIYTTHPRKQARTMQVDATTLPITATVENVSTQDQDYILGTIGVDFGPEPRPLIFPLTDNQGDDISNGLQDLGNAPNGLPYLNKRKAFHARAERNAAYRYRLTAAEFTAADQNRHLNARLTFAVTLGFDVIEHGPEVNKPAGWKERHLTDGKSAYETHVCPYCGEEDMANIDREPEYEEAAFTCLTCDCRWFTSITEKIVVIEEPRR